MRPSQKKIALQKAAFEKNSEVLIGLQAEIKQEEDQLFDQKQGLANIDEQMELMQAELLGVTERLEQLEGQRNVALERKKHSNENELAMHENLQQLEAKITAFEMQKQVLLQEKLEKRDGARNLLKRKESFGG